MNRLKRQLLASVCIGFFVLYLVALWGLTAWKTEDLRDSMYQDFMAAYEMLFQRSSEPDFAEDAERQFTELSTTLAQRNIYAAAVLLDAQGEILVRSDIGNIQFGQRGLAANRSDLTRLEDCIRDAGKGGSDEGFSRGPGAAISSVGPSGYTQGWAVTGQDGAGCYIFINAKFFEGELAVKSMLSHYILTFAAMALTCLLLCFIIARLLNRHTALPHQTAAAAEQ